jgi:hypothetical protein
VARRCELCGGEAVPAERFCEAHVLVLGLLRAETRPGDTLDFELDLAT